MKRNPNEEENSKNEKRQPLFQTEKEHQDDES
jgi:hypothetical protein